MKSILGGLNRKSPLNIFLLTIVVLMFVGVGSLTYNLIAPAQIQPPIEKTEVKTTPVMEEVKFSTPVPAQVKGSRTTTQPSSDPDPIGPCFFKKSGQSLQMKSSVCKSSFECEINHAWYPFTSREKCTQKQNEWIASLRTNTPYKFEYNFDTSPLKSTQDIPPMNLPEVKTQPVEPFPKYGYVNPSPTPSGITGCQAGCDPAPIKPPWNEGAPSVF